MRIENIQKEIRFHGNSTDENISNVEVKQAFLLLKSMTLSDVDDYFLYFSAINLLDAYVNRQEASEEFKSQYLREYFINEAVDFLIDNDIRDITFSHNTSENDSELIVNIDDTKFAFNNVTPSDKMVLAANNELVQYEKQELEGANLQPFAKSIFKSATKLDRLCQETTAGCTIDELLQIVREEFLQEDYIKNGKGAEVVNDFNRAIEIESKEAKAYYIGIRMNKESKKLLDSLNNAKYIAEKFINTINYTFEKGNVDSSYSTLNNSKEVKVDMDKLFDKLEERGEINFAKLPDVLSAYSEEELLNSYSALVYIFQKEWACKNEFASKFFDCLEERVAANIKAENSHYLGFLKATDSLKANNSLIESDDVIKEKANTKVNQLRKKLSKDIETGFYKLYLNRNKELIEQEEMQQW